MISVHFKETNANLQKPRSMTDEECGPLPVFRDGKTRLSCWKMTWRERLSALFFGRAWLWVWFGHTQPPVALETAKTVFADEAGILRRLWDRLIFDLHDQETGRIDLKLFAMRLRVYFLVPLWRLRIIRRSTAFSWEVAVAIYRRR